MCLHMGLFEFILFLVCLISWICKFVSFAKSRKLSAITSSNFFSSPLVFLSFWDPNDTNIRSFFIVTSPLHFAIEPIQWTFNFGYGIFRFYKKSPVVESSLVLGRDESMGSSLHLLWFHPKKGEKAFQGHSVTSRCQKKFRLLSPCWLEWELHFFHGVCLG